MVDARSRIVFELPSEHLLAEELVEWLVEEVGEVQTGAVSPAQIRVR